MMSDPRYSPNPRSWHTLPAGNTIMSGITIWWKGETQHDPWFSGAHVADVVRCALDRLQFLESMTDPADRVYADAAVHLEAARLLLDNSTTDQPR